MLTPPPMIHTKLLFLSSGSWEVGSLGCENIGRDQISPKPQNSQNLSNYSPGTPHRCQDFGNFGEI